MSANNNVAFDPTDIYNQKAIVGTTQTPDSLITVSVQTEEIQFPNGSKLTGLSQNFKENQYDTCPSSFALFLGLSTLDSSIKAIDPNSNFFKDNTVISLPLINSNFAPPWERAGNWSVVDDQAYYTGVINDLENYLKIPSSVIPFVGYYYLNLSVARLDSGYLKVYDHTDKLVATINKAGEYNIEMYIASPDVTTFRIVSEGTFPGDYVNIDTARFCRVTDRFRDYFLYLIDSLGLQGANEELIKKVVAEVVAVALGDITQKLVDTDLKITDHENANGNVHNLTLTDLKAAADNHTHPEFALFQQAIDKLVEHMNDTATNPHGISCAMIHAATDDHKHKPEECGAAPTDHAHPDLAKAADLTDLKTNLPTMIDDEISKQILSSNFGAAPYIITEPKSLGEEPIMAEDSLINKPATMMLFPYVLHQSTSDYDYKSGYAEANRLGINSKSAALAFSDYYCTCFSVQESATSIPETILQYTFHTPREISGLSIFKDVSNAVTGYASSIAVYVDGALVGSISNLSWSDFNKRLETDALGHTDILFTKISGTQIKLVINGAKMDSSLQWAIRVRFKFTDVPSTIPGTFTINAPFKMNFGMVANTTIDGNMDGSGRMSGTVDLPTLDSPTYIYLKKSGDTSYTTQMDSIPSEFSRLQLGQNVLLNKYLSTNSHPAWGTISANSEDPSYPVRNIYNDGSSYYKGVNGATSVVLTHTFAQPQSGISGLRFIFAELLAELNLIPDTISVQFITQPNWQSGDTTEVALAPIVISDVIPIRRANGSGFIWKKLYFTEDNRPKQISKVIMTLYGNKNQPALAMSNFCMMLRGWWFNPWSGASTNIARCPFGRFERVALPATSTLTGAIEHSGVSTGKCTYYPIDHFNVLSAGTYQIPNPFSTQEVTADIMAMTLAAGSSGSTNIQNLLTEVENLPSIVSTSSNEPLAEITQISVDHITIQVYSTGRYAVKVFRLW